MFFFIFDYQSDEKTSTGSFWMRAEQEIIIFTYKDQGGWSVCLMDYSGCIVLVYGHTCPGNIRLLQILFLNYCGLKSVEYKKIYVLLQRYTVGKYGRETSPVRLIPRTIH